MPSSGLAPAWAGLPIELDQDLVAGQRAPAGHGMVGGMEHHCRIHPGKDAPVNHGPFAAAPLLRRGADDLQRASQLGQDCLDRQSGSDGGRADEVMSTCMAQAGQRVVLGQKGHRGPTPLPFHGGYKGCVEAGYCALDGKPILLERAAQQRR